MAKYVLRHSDDNTGIAIDAASLEAWIETVRSAADGDRDAIEVLPAESRYIAERLSDLIRDDDAPDRAAPTDLA